MCGRYPILNAGKRPRQFVRACCLLAFLILCCQWADARNTATDSVVIREVHIPMPDGVQLAADLYTPAQLQAGEALPVILEYLPYRKDEGRGNRYPLFAYFVRRGYIVARVDIRGTGRSQGTLVDGEYSEQEQADGEEVIDWLSKQPFSTGKIAMLGISWGGFNGLHMAMRRPPALKTCISLMSTDDIYEDDVHFMDGMMHIDAYEIGQDLANAQPGAPDYKIDETYFRERFDTYPWLLKYKQHQNDGPFWNRASLNEDYSKINIPLFVIGGWYDGYRDFIPRIIKNANAPIKAILGPWNHTWPNLAAPGPAVEWREVAVRWLDHWLKDRDTGILTEPRLVYYQRFWHPPGHGLSYIPGRWKQAGNWPETRDTTFYLSEDHTLGSSPSPFRHSLKYKPTVGVEASGSVMWWGDWAPDQKAADVYSLVYETQPLEDSLEILGFPEITLQTRVNSTDAHWFARLSDVAPDGQVTQVTGAGFNARHLASSSKPRDLIPDSLYTIPIELHATSWTFQPGHRIRIAVNNAQWPMIWPTPYPMETRVLSAPNAASVLRLPLVSESARLLQEPFPDPASDPELPGFASLSAETVSGFAEIREIRRDERSQETSVQATNSGSDQYPWGVISYSEEITHHLSDPEPARAGVESTYTTTISAGGRTLQLTGILHFRSDVLNYYYDYTRKLEENGKLIREKNWRETIPKE